MLKANVGLSRKITRDFNSTGYSVNLEGEIPFPTDDAQGVLEKVRELFSLAQEALTLEMDRDQGEDAIGRRDEERPAPTPQPNGNGNGHADRPSSSPAPPPTPANGNGTNNGQAGNDEAATNKQVQFLLTMGKRFKLSTPQLENRVAEIIGRRCGVYDLTKKEAGQVLDHFTKAANGNGNGNGNSRQGRRSFRGDNHGPSNPLELLGDQPVPFLPPSLLLPANHASAAEERRQQPCPGIIGPCGSGRVSPDGATR